MHKRFTIPAIVVILVSGASAQGFLGRLKQEAIDTAKKTVDGAANQSAPAVELPKNTGNQALGNQEAYVEKQKADEEQRKKELERQTAERDAAIAQKNAEIEKRRAENDARQKEIQAEHQATIEKMEAEQKEREARREKEQMKIQAERQATIEKMEAEHKEREARREAERVERLQRQKEKRARREKEQMERVAQKRREDQDRIFDALRKGDGIKTAEQAEARLKDRDLWQDGMEARIKEVIAERMSKAAQNKFPMSDTFKVPVKVYKEFESGMSLEWCTAKLETEGKKMYTVNNTIVLEIDDSEVTLIFKKMSSEKPPILTACVVKLPAGIPHAQVLEKYKNEFPNAKVKHEETSQKLPAQKNYVMDGNTLDTQFSMIQVADTIESPDRTVTIESRFLAGKAYIADYNIGRRVLVCEAAKDGTVTVPSGLDARQKDAASVVKDQLLSAIRRTSVVLEDTMLAQALRDMQEAERKNEQNKQQQKNAAALAF